MNLDSDHVKRTLICSAYPFGYGPAAKLLHIARGLRPLGMRLVFVGTGIAHELAARTTLFDEVVQAAPSDDRVRTLLRSAAGLLSLMDREYAAVAVELGRPVFVADSLLWLRHEVPPVFRQARRYWAQEFVGVRERLSEAGPSATLVGPIVAPADSGAPGRNTRLVVNLGGCESPLGSAEDDPSYMDFVYRVLLERVLPGTQGPAVLLAGDKCIRYLRSRYSVRGGKSRLEMLSSGHEDALALLRTARSVVTSPGLTACLECFHLGVPTFFLPPQNYSQWWILNKLRARGLAPGALHWEDILPGCPVVERMPEELRGALVGGAIRRLTADACAEQLLGEGLAAFLTSDSRAIACRQRAFFEALGPNGAQQIVHDLASLC